MFDIFCVFLLYNSYFYNFIYVSKSLFPKLCNLIASYLKLECPKLQNK